jgi:hypothetical protein
MTDFRQPVAPTRAELSTFLKDQKLIKAFEALFNLVPSEFDLADVRIQEIMIDIGNIAAASNETAALLTRLVDEVELLNRHNCCEVIEENVENRTISINDDNWNGTPLAIEHGGTGADNLVDAQINLGITGGVGENLIFTLVTQVAHGFLSGEAVYFDGANWLSADNTAAATVCGYVVDYVDANHFKAVTDGVIVVAGLTSGAWYYLGTSGALTTTAPVASGTFAQSVGQAISTNNLFVNVHQAIEN